MQPHSMCAVELAHLIWNKHMDLSSCRLRVRYYTPFGQKNNYYELREIDHSGNRFSVNIMRSGGGLACTITAKKDSNDRVEMIHSVQHVAGLTEIFILRKDEIIGGEHRNSMRYRNFSGRIKSDETTMELTCEVRSANNKDFNKYPYELSVDSKQLKNEKDQKSKVK